MYCISLPFNSSLYTAHHSSIILASGLCTSLPISFGPKVMPASNRCSAHHLAPFYILSFCKVRVRYYSATHKGVLPLQIQIPHSEPENCSSCWILMGLPMVGDPSLGEPMVGEPSTGLPNNGDNSAFNTETTIGKLFYACIVKINITIFIYKSYRNIDITRNFT